MKKIAILSALIATPAYAHLLPLEDKALLDATDGDVGAAFRMEETCDALSLSGPDCHDLMGVGNSDQSKAATKCVVSQYVPPYAVNLQAKNEAPGARGHEFGGQPHQKAMWTKEEGNHFYIASPEIKKAAKDSLRTKLINDRVAAKTAANGISSKSKDVTKSADLGVNSGITLEGDIGVAKGSVSTGVGSTGGTSVSHGQSKQEALLTPEEMAAIEKESDAALSNTRLGGYEMDMVCSDLYPNCMGASAAVIPSPLWRGAPPKENKDTSSPGKARSSKPLSGSASKNPPKSDGDKKDASADIIEHHDAGSWAGGGEKPSDGTMIARGVEGENNPLRENISKCIEKEKRKILKERGSKTLDPNAESLDEKKERAEEALKAGFCDESYLGHAFCLEFKNKQASNFDEESKMEREEARANALEMFKASGVCNPTLLGRAFCKTAKDKIITNPVGGGLKEESSPGVFKPKPKSDTKVNFGILRP